MSSYRIVIGFDFTDQAKLALDQAVAAAKAQGDRTELHLIQTVEEGEGEHPLQRYDRKTELGNAEATLVEHANTQLSGPPEGTKVLAHARVGGAAEEILKLAHDLTADLIVIGTHGRKGLERWVLGSVAETVVRLACCPVLVARPKNYADKALPDEAG